jgi:hypothetical protein
MDAELSSHLEAVKAQMKIREGENVQNTIFTALIGAILGYWAWQTIAHAAFAFFLLFSISAVGNRVTSELFRIRAQQMAADITEKQRVL